jgi:enamine deaminase RidA (YjgF/YER057c/UK114 family)
MAIEKIQPEGVGQPLGLYSHGVEANGLVVVAGQVGTKPSGEVAGHATSVARPGRPSRHARDGRSARNARR